MWIEHPSRGQHSIAAHSLCTCWGNMPLCGGRQSGVTGLNAWVGKSTEECALCPCATAEDVESLGSPPGCPCGLWCCVYAGRTPASLNDSLRCSCSPWHAMVRQRATSLATCIRAWSKRCCRVKVTWTCGTSCTCAGRVAALGNNELRCGALLLDLTAIMGRGNRSLTSGLGPLVA